MTGSPLSVPQLNLAFAWLWIFAGFISGALLGLRFQNKDWMGGYTSFPRRLYRLGHISFFGLGLINLLFYFTFRSLGPDSSLLPWAAWSFIIAVADPRAVFRLFPGSEPHGCRAGRAR